MGEAGWSGGREGWRGVGGGAQGRMVPEGRLPKVVVRPLLRLWCGMRRGAVRWRWRVCYVRIWVPIFAGIFCARCSCDGVCRVLCLLSWWCDECGRMSVSAGREWSALCDGRCADGM